MARPNRSSSPKKGLTYSQTISPVAGDLKQPTSHAFADQGVTVREALRSTDEAAEEVPAGHWASNSATVLGDLEEARKIAEAALAPAEKLRHRVTLTIALYTNALMSHMAGDFKEARDLSGQALV